MLFGNVGENAVCHDLYGGDVAPDQLTEVMPLVGGELVGFVELVDHLLAEHDAAGGVGGSRGGWDFVNV